MKKRNKEINVFSMSAIDLFCSALGAFMVIALIAMPYYMKNGQSAAPMRNLKKEIKSVENEIQEAQKIQEALNLQAENLNEIIDEKNATKNKKQQKIEELKRELGDTFFIVIASWNVNADIDLYIEDPTHRGYNFLKKTHPDAVASLAEDSKKEGIEAFETSRAIEGTYEFHLVCFKNPSKGDVEVHMRAYTKRGKMTLNTFKFDGSKNHSFTYKIEVLENGNIKSSTYEKSRNLSIHKGGYVNKNSPWN